MYIFNEKYGSSCISTPFLTPCAGDVMIHGKILIVHDDEKIIWIIQTESEQIISVRTRCPKKGAGRDLGSLVSNQ